MGANALKADKQAERLENELSDMQSFVHTNKLLRKVFRISERPEAQVISELSDSLNLIHLDKTGESALDFISNVTPDIVEKVHHLNLSQDYATLKKDFYYIPGKTNSEMPHLHELPFAISYYVKTDENREKALQIVGKILANAKRNE